jgi:hypothetical protein
MAPKKRKGAPRPAPKKKPAKRRRRASPPRPSNDPPAAPDVAEPEPEVLPVISQDGDDDPISDEDSSSEDENESKDVGPINIEDVIRKIEILSQYPLKPSDYFAQRSAEISISEKGREVLRTIFSVETYLPKELTDICVSYYEEKVETMVERTLEDFQYFSNGKVLDRLVLETPPSARAPLRPLLISLHARGPHYLWWFLLRTGIPSFIPLGDASTRHIGEIWTLFHDGKTVAGISFCEEPDMLFVGLPEDIQDGRKKGLEWTSLMDAVPHPDLIGPCLNTSTVTLEQLTECAVALEARTKRAKEKWLASLFALHRGFAAMYLWISDSRMFAHNDDPKAAQVESRSEWNGFYRQYKCADPFYMRTKKKEDCEEKPEDTYLCYA